MKGSNMAERIRRKLVVFLFGAAFVNVGYAQNTVTTVLAYPTGDPASSGLLVRKSAPAEVMANQTYTYSLEAYNKTSSTLCTVVIRETLPEGFVLEGTSPKAEVEGRVVTWKMEALYPSARKQFTITGMPGGTADLISCTSASYSLQACVLTKVLQPALKLAVKSPKVVLQCDPIVVDYEITNHGSGTTRNVTVSHPLPKGLMTLDDGATVVFTLESLAPGQSTSCRKLLKAARAGTFSSEAVASADYGLQSSVKINTRVVAPVLTVDISGVEKIYLGKQMTYLIKVANAGDGIANNVSLVCSLPADARVQDISHNGRGLGNEVVWERLGALMPNQSVTASLTLEPRQRGIVDVIALAKATCASEVKAAASTLVEGIPAVLLEVIDLSDPVPLGEEVTYTIRVTNQGSADGTNIMILAELEDAMQYVSSGGASTAQASGNFVRFTPLKQLPPKQTAIWQVTVKAIRPGDVRFRVKLQSDQIERSVDESEATNFYR
jgi:uncharacterized repeat protein (TIGR01451 family)